MLTPAILLTVCPKAPAARAARIVRALHAACAESTIRTAPRLAAFLAQAAHESGEFRWWRELWGPTPQQQRYDPPGELAARLGNTEPGDGLRYRGRGPFQLTGRANYRAAGQALGVPLEDDPERAAEIPTGCRVAVWFWDSRRLSPLADAGTASGFRTITQRINGGYHGLADRERYHAAARAALGLTPVTED